MTTPLSFSQLHDQLNDIITAHLSIDHLNARIEDLPHQFQHPQTRPWQPIHWAEIHPDQIIGIKPAVFLSILSGAINTEAPIRDYTQTSRQYLAPFYPQMARFVGGTVDANGHLLEPGLWEKEERQHTPALAKLYAQLGGSLDDQPPLTITPHTARPYRPSDDLRQDLYRHGLHRIATEYGATCLYLWLMVHTTGALQAVLEELLIDEINHMTKFWGFGLWAYPDSSFFKISQTLVTALRQKWANPQIQGSLLHTLHRMTKELHWSDWSFTNQTILMYIFGRVMQRLLQWHQRLTPDYLRALLGDQQGNYEGNPHLFPEVVKFS
jgi:hypothetical protein